MKGIINWKSPDVSVSSGAQITVCDQKPNICSQILLNPYYLYIQTKLSLHLLCKIYMMQNQTKILLNVIETTLAELKIWLHKCISISLKYFCNTLIQSIF